MSQVMNKKALIDAVAEKLDITKKDAKLHLFYFFQWLHHSRSRGLFFCLHYIYKMKPSKTRKAVS